MDLGSLNWLAIVAAAVATFILGGLWYSPIMFYGPWLRASGLTEESVKGGNPAMIYGVSLVLQVIAAVVLAMFLAKRDFGFVVAASLSVGVAWVATAMGVTYLFERRPLSLFLIDAGYHIVAYGLMGVILGAWR